MSHFKDTVHSKAPYSVRIVEFGCRNCGRRWSSANGSLDDYQKCKNCYTECYPVGSRIREPNKFGNENRQTFQAHNKELCGKCARLGRSCMMLGNESDNDADDMDMYIKTVPQTHQSNAREHRQDGNRPVAESYSLNHWPELATFAFRFRPTSYTPRNSNKIRLVSNLNDATSAGMTAAETLTDVIHNARQETVHDELSEDFFLWEDLNEGGEDEVNYQQNDDGADEIWDYETFINDNDQDNEDDELHYNNIANRLYDDLGMSDDDIDEETSSDNEVVALNDDTDDAEHYYHQDLQSYSSSQDEAICFDGMDDMSSDDNYYEKQMNNRLLRRGRKHALQGRKNSLKLLVD